MPAVKFVVTIYIIIIVIEVSRTYGQNFVAVRPSACFGFFFPCQYSDRTFTNYRTRDEQPKGERGAQSTAKAPKPIRVQKQPARHERAHETAERDSDQSRVSPVQGHTGVEDQVQKVQAAESGEELQQVSPEVRERGLPHVVSTVLDRGADLSQVRRAVERMVEGFRQNDVRERRR